MRSRSFRNQDGASLVIVLVVMAVFGLILGGLMTETGASTRYTTTVSNYEKKVYAADAGVAAGIQQLQQHNELCPTAGSSETLQTVNINGYDVSVACEVTAGSTVGGLGYAIITLSPGANSLVTQGGSDPKLVNGPVYVGGTFDGNPGMKVTNGTFKQGTSSGCTSATPSGLTLDTGYTYKCGAAEPNVDVPTTPALPSTPRASQTFGTCTYFYPGKYTTAPTLSSGTNYFASGVYYFENVGQWPINKVVFGGAPATYESVRFKSPVPAAESYTPMPTCANDSDAISKAGGNAPEVTGTGAQFVLGGNSTIYLDNGSQLEVFARTLDGTSETATASIVAVPDSWAAWTQSTDNLTVYDFHNGSNPDSVIHGLVYLPEQNARLWSTNNVYAAVLGGIVAWELELQSSASGSGLQVSAGDGEPEPRHLVISSTAPSSPDPDAGRQVTSTAVVEIANDGAKTITVHSWRTKGLTESL
jgi:hypothetical protein